MTATKQIRVRFAPSPTGLMHIGNVRTALYNYLHARHYNGAFILRIEDTDRARSTQEFTDKIIESLEWLGLEYDEGPFFQSKRTELYMAAANRLIEEGKAYRCYCTPEELDAMREEARANGLKPMYNGKCRDLPRSKWRDDKPYTIRFRSPDEGETSFVDLVRGEVSFQNSEIDDLVIVRSEGSPTYNFCVVVDDQDMGITNVIRGEDHITNTPRQIQLYRAFGFEPPRFAHIPLILNKERKPYSKRDGLAGIEEFKNAGFLPQALVNYMARLGWGHGDDEIFTLESLIEYFDVKDVSKSGAVFDFEKLNWLNSHYIKNTPEAELATMLAERLQQKGEADIAKLAKIAVSLKERARTLKEMAEMSAIFFPQEIVYDEKAANKFLTPESIEALSQLKTIYEKLSEFSHDPIKEATEKFMAEKELSLKKVAQPLRVALTGSTVSPGIFETLELIGREESLKRIEAACRYAAKK